MHSGPGSKNVYQTLIAAEYAGVNVKIAENCIKWFTTYDSSLKQVLVLDTPEGSAFESNAIASYVARGSSLLGSSEVECGQIEQWIVFSSFELDANLRGWVLPRLGYENYIKPESYIANTKGGLAALNAHLAAHTFLVGHSVTLADIITTCNLFYGFKMLMPKSFTSLYPHVERYFWTMVNQPNFKKVTGQVKQAEAVLPLPSAKKPEQPIEVKPIWNASIDLAGEEDEEAPNLKAKNPLVGFCDNNFTPFLSGVKLDDYNRNFRKVAIEGFWEKFDPNGYSIWFCTYKYDDENTLSYAIMKSFGEYLQRIDLARRHAFGKMFVSGNMAPFKAKGLWVFHGSEIPHYMIEEHYDMEHYKWTKVDLSDKSQKEHVNQMIEDMERFEIETLLDYIY